MPLGVKYAVNGIGVTSPDEEKWTPNDMGSSLRGTEKRSPYKSLQWTRQAVEHCDDDWTQYDNTVLDSLTTRPDGGLAEYETYTDVICTRVYLRMRRGLGAEMVAEFLVNEDSAV